MKAIAFTPGTAHVRAFQPRAWLAVQPEEPALLTEEPGGRKCLWACLIFNGGPELTDLVLEIEPINPEVSAVRYEIPSLEEGGYFPILLGSPSEQPPHGIYRLAAQGRADTPVSLEAHFSGLTPPRRIALGVSRFPSLPLAPAASWSPEEYVQVLDRSALHTGQRDGSLPALAFTQRVARLMRGIRGVPSHGAARELAWSAVRAVFGASDPDLERRDVSARLDDLAGDVEELASFHDDLLRPLSKVPPDEIALAVVPGPEPALYLLNNLEEPVPEVAVRVDRFHWSEEAAVLAPRRFRVGTVAPRSAVLVTRLGALDLACTLECTVETGPVEDYLKTSLRGAYPSGAGADDGSLIPVRLLDGALAEVRRMEITSLEEKPPDLPGPTRMAA